MPGFIIECLLVLGLGCLTGIFGLCLVTQYVSQKNWADWSQQRLWIMLWATGGVVEIGGWLLRSAAGGIGTWPQWGLQWDALGVLLICLGPTLWLIAVFILRPQRTKLERITTQPENPEEEAWPPPPSNRNA